MTGKAGALKRWTMRQLITKSLLASLCLCIGGFAASVPVQAADIAADDRDVAERAVSLQFDCVAEGDERIAWIANHLGARNIWLGERTAAGAVNSRALTRFEGDNGIELDNLHWSHDGSMLVFARGGSLEGGGPVNPLSLRGGPVAMEVAALRLASGEIRSFGLGAGAVPSPVGDEVVFVRDGQIWIGNLSQRCRGNSVAARSRRGQRTVMVAGWQEDRLHQQSPRLFVGRRPGSRGSASSLDESKRRQRQQPALVTRWQASGVDPYSVARSAALHRRVHAQSRGTTMVGARGRRCKRSWQGCMDCRCRPRQCVPGHRNRSEPVLDHGRSTAVSLGSHGLAAALFAGPEQKGARPVALSPDGAETFAATLDNTGRNVIFSSNAEDDDHRHLWRVAVGGGRAERLSKGASIEDFPVVTPTGRAVRPA